MKTHSFLILILLLLHFKLSFSQTFVEQTAVNLVGVYAGKVSWVDYDNDGDLDIFLSGSDVNFASTTRLYKNNGTNSFTYQSGLNFIGLCYTDFDWGDYDNDGDLDLIISGYTGTNWVFKIYKNNITSFTEQTSIVLPNFEDGSVAWGDFNNDGKLDFSITGYNSTLFTFTKIYKNNGNNTFTELTGNSIVGTSGNKAQWIDYNKDGYLDFSIDGSGNSSGLGVYKNNGNNTFTYTFNFGYPYGTFDWGDYDNDGDFDLIATGSSSGPNTVILKNSYNFNLQGQMGINLTSLDHGPALWGDLDNDGLLDLIYNGQNMYSVSYTKVYKNNGNNTFTEQVSISLPAYDYCALDLGDYDNDGDLDILISGRDINSNVFTKVYKNTTTVVNAAPSAPAGLTTNYPADSIKFLWNKSTDNTTPSIALNYELRIGTSLFGSELISSSLNPVTGFKRKVGKGNVQDTFYTFASPQYLCGGTKLYWSVYSIDNSFRASNLSSVDSILNPLYIHALGDTLISIFDTAQLNVTHNTCANVSYLWSPSNSLNFSNIKNPKAFPLKTTMYYVTVTQNSVSKIDSVLVKVNPFKEQTNVTLDGLGNCSLAWGDYDNDGDLDLLACGSNNGSSYGAMSKIYKNNGDGTFTFQSAINLIPVYQGASAWGDYDNDGDLDIAISGFANTGAITKIYRNNGNNTFTEQSTIQLTGVFDGSLDWGDYDNDGDLDLLMTGLTGSLEVTKIYKNNRNNTFSEVVGLTIPKVYLSSAVWGDYNNDGYLDILISGSSPNGKITKLYKNIGEDTFVENSKANLIALENSHLAWGDYDSDGDLDILTSGSTGNGGVLKLYKNSGNDSFAIITTLNFANLEYGSVAWGDYDNDGYLDILATGKIGQNSYSKVYRYAGTDIFKEQTEIVLYGISNGAAIWGDFDNDNDLDVLISGINGNNRIAKLYKNEIPNQNIRPSKPQNLQFSNLNRKFSWNQANDDHTPVTGLTYNFAIGNKNEFDTFFPSQSIQYTGFHKVSCMGGQQSKTFAFIEWKMFPFDSTYYARVQAIDNSFVGSLFSDSITFKAPPVGKIQMNDTTLPCGKSLQLDVEVFNGNKSNLTYSWTPSIGLSDPGICNPIANPLQDVLYKVVATSPMGLSFTDSIQVHIIPLHVSISPVNKTCFDTATFAATVNSNSPTITYSWFPVLGLSNPNILNPLVFASNTATYILTASDGLCIDSDTAIVKVNSFLTAPALCLCTVDTNLNKNRIRWNKSLNTGISSYNIYGEVTNSGVSTKIGNQNYANAGDFIDPYSLPSIKSKKYKITAVDTCGNESDFSNEHKTIFLKVTKNNTTSWKLNWDIFSGTDFLQYKIYRGSSISNLLLLDSVSKNTLQYIDTNISGIQYYCIEVKSLDSCSTFSSSLSNIGFYNYVKIDEPDNSVFEFKIFPNPNSGEFTVKINAFEKNTIHLKVISLLGRELYNQSIEMDDNELTEEVKLNFLSKGVYILELERGGKKNLSKLIFQ